MAENLLDGLQIKLYDFQKASLPTLRVSKIFW